jgi:hypothetical protein
VYNFFTKDSIKYNGRDHDAVDTVNNLPVAAFVAWQQLLAAAMIIFDDLPKKFEARMEKKRRRELAPYNRNAP